MQGREYTINRYKFATFSISFHHYFKYKIKSMIHSVSVKEKLQSTKLLLEDSFEHKTTRMTFRSGQVERTQLTDLNYKFAVFSISFDHFFSINQINDSFSLSQAKATV